MFNLDFLCKNKTKQESSKSTNANFLPSKHGNYFLHSKQESSKSTNANFLPSKNGNYFLHSKQESSKTIISKKDKLKYQDLTGTWIVRLLYTHLVFKVIGGLLTTFCPRILLMRCMASNQTKFSSQNMYLPLKPRGNFVCVIYNIE